ncbi:probable glutamate receptor [Orussus abietinus]|uniref:probable glutamate receptor n=1 Tax=Orussus abietinus TaxID=222816 RepID=UPI00062519B7|nr:probable glutamate receptor [Orussus abietinus]
MAARPLNVAHSVDIEAFYERHLSRPLFAVLLRTSGDLDGFVDFAATFPMRIPHWLVLFSRDSGNASLAYCRDPVDNSFRFRFDTHSLVKCADDPEVHEWYVVRRNRISRFHLANWENGRLVATTSLTLYLRRNNLDGKTLRVVTMDSGFVQIRDGRILGLGGSILEQLSETLKFKINVVKRELDYGSPIARNRSWSGTIGQIHSGNADLGAAELTMSADRMEVVDFTLPLMTSRNLLYLRKPDGSGVQWSGYFKTFSRGIWATIVGLIVATPAIVTSIKRCKRCCASSSRVSDNYLNVWGIFCQQGLSEYPLDTSLRLAYFSTFVSALIVSAAYSASLISFLAVSAPSLPFSTLDGYVNDGSYKLIVFRSSSYYDMFKDSKDPVYSKMMGLMKREEELPKTTLNACLQVCKQRVALYLNEDTRNALRTPLPCQLVTVETGRLDRMAMALTKHSQYTRLFNFILLRYFDNGVIIRLKRRYLLTPVPEVRHGTVTVWGIAPILAIVVGGMVLSAVVLIVENLYFIFKQKAAKNRSPKQRKETEPDGKLKSGQKRLSLLTPPKLNRVQPIKLYYK